MHSPPMYNLTVHFKVQDFNAWRIGYNSHEKSRASAGITNGSVFRSAHDPNDIVLLQDVAEAETRRPACPGRRGYQRTRRT
jgi:hypothetical protein